MQYSKHRVPTLLITLFLVVLVLPAFGENLDVYELTDLLYDNYGIRFDRHDIKSKILPGTQMYYSDITEKLYADYEIYFDEI